MKVKVKMFVIYLDYSIYTTFLFISILFLFIYLYVLYEFRKQNKSFYVQPLFFNDFTNMHCFYLCFYSSMFINLCLSLSYFTIVAHFNHINLYIIDIYFSIFIDFPHYHIKIYKSAWSSLVRAVLHLMVTAMRCL